MQENKENVCSYSNRDISSQNSSKMMPSPSKSNYRDCNDSTFMDDSSSSWLQQSDATFETMERMCNKTLSDPNNTIHEYLANLEKKKSSTYNDDKETDAMNRLFAEFGINSDNSKFVDQTQLNEVEPPSCLWENTVNNESALQTSPVKMVGLLRPSTILEESASDSVSSYTSADRFETISSGQYATANETNRVSAETDREGMSNGTSNSAQSDTDNSGASKSSASVYFDLFPLRKIPFFEENTESRLYHKTIFLKDNKTSSVQKDESVGDLSSRTSNTSHGISSISIDSLEESKPKRRSSLNFPRSGYQNPPRRNRSRGSTKRSLTGNESSKLENNSIIIVSDDDSGTVESDDLNNGFVDELDDTRDRSNVSSDTSDLNISHGFNDTLEEMEYIMKQGMKYLTEKQATPKQQIQTAIVQYTPSPMASPITPSTVVLKPKPFLSSQKKPSALSARALFGITHADRFDHIMSPVRAYIHNTPKSPITTLMKPTQNIFDSTKLARESRQFDTKTPLQSERNAICSLPKKAYVSSEFHHVVDQRSPIAIPGGDKIHRYLEPSKVPAVLRHEGKFKTTMTSREKSDLDKSMGSLADFSLASGDMSVLLLRDAKHLAGK